MYAWCGAADMDSRFRGNDGEGGGNDGSIKDGGYGSRGLPPREWGMTEAWRGEAFAFHPPPGLPPDRGEEKKSGLSP